MHCVSHIQYTSIQTHAVVDTLQLGDVTLVPQCALAESEN
jgi:hypothetical protein